VGLSKTEHSRDLWTQSRFACAQRSAIKQQAQLLMICGLHSSHSEVIFYSALRNSGDDFGKATLEWMKVGIRFTHQDPTDCGLPLAFAEVG